VQSFLDEAVNGVIEQHAIIQRTITMKLKCVYINIFGKRQVMIARMQYALPNE
jgi:hypothetical protein